MTASYRRPSRLENLLLKPYYWRSPARAVRRALSRGPHGDPRVVRLPWGLALECDPRDAIGGNIVRSGIYEVVTTETLFRLVDRGDAVVDVGANIGYVTSILAKAAGPDGTVIAFEPHPELFSALTENIGRWEGVAPVDARRKALSDRLGTSSLHVGDEFGTNRGTATLTGGGGIVVEVALARFDEEVAGRVGVMKLDVEGHELAVLEGAAEALGEGRIRDVIFEEHDMYPTPVTDRLEQFGYEILPLRQRWRGVTAISPSELPVPTWDPPNFLATRDPERARRRLSANGWMTWSS